MGILTLLRNAFGRPRKGPKAEAEGAEQAPAQEPTPTAAQQPEPKVPAQSSSDDEHELVSAAFDNIAVPKPATPADATEEPAATTPEPEPGAAAQESEPATEPEPTPAPAATEQPEPEATPEPTTEEPTPEPEPAAAEQESESEPTPEPVAQEPTPAPEPEVVEPQSEPDPAPAPETVAEQPTPEPEPQAEAEAEPEADAPQAADGDEAPQGPPAPDNETRTGGAGGNNPAEGEAEAEQPTTEPEPEPTAEAETEPEPQSQPQPQPQPQPDAEENTAPAVPPTLTTAYHAAASALAKYDLTGTRATVYLVLDRSASMRPYYKDGSAQALGEQTLALAAHLDPEATVQVVFFSTEVDGTGELTLAEHENRVDDLHGSLGRMGRTSYHAAVDAVLAHRAESAGDPAAPALVIFQTDGAPDAKTPATQSLTDAAKKHPSVFFSFVAFGEHDHKAFDYLRKLKTGTAAFFHAGPAPRELTDQELYEGVLANWRP
ncbi:VWA domain-containing protein [Streptomyces sp. NPDC058451]|uniref:VWA domain-containing protein n=1 Tax=Streptomyces sp. NPDC058451 TaxID=3346506 RepID=UPI00364CE1BA